jgi:hypothetical protein
MMYQERASAEACDFSAFAPLTKQFPFLLLNIVLLVLVCGFAVT